VVSLRQHDNTTTAQAVLTLHIRQRLIAPDMLPLKRLQEPDEHLVLDAPLERRVRPERAERVVLDCGISSTRCLFGLTRRVSSAWLNFLPVL